jgi:chromosome segregation ATPase
MEEHKRGPKSELFVGIDMSTKADQVFDLIKQGKSFVEIRSLIKGDSSIAQGIQRYLDWADAEVRRLRGVKETLEGESSTLEGKVRILKEEKGTLGAGVEKFNLQLKGLSADISDKTEKRDALKRELTTTRKELDGLKGEIKELVGRGYTDDIVSKLVESDAKSGATMLNRVQTTAKYEAERSKLAGDLKKLDQDIGQREDERKQLLFKIKNLTERSRKA